MSNRRLFVGLAVIMAAATGFAVWAFLSFRAAERNLAELDRAAEERAEERKRLEQEERERRDRERPVVAELPVAPPPREAGVPLSVSGRLIEVLPNEADEPRESLPIALGPAVVGKKKPDADPDPNTAKARGLRWVIRFQVADGKDYVRQLRLLEAEVLIPLSPDGKESLLVTDLAEPARARQPTDADIKRLGEKLKFSDARAGTAAQVAEALGIEKKPKQFLAFFPKSVEEELARKETSYRNRRSEDIEETVFRVVIRGGKYEVLVVEQRVKP
jgi:hypothetical protein